jgi:very-short-patch-repair endonuclease
MVRHLHGAIAERSRTQLGLITRAQVLELGCTEHRLWHLLDIGALERIEPGVFRIGGAPVSWRQRLLAGLLGLGPDAHISHLAAAALWHLDGVTTDEAEFVVPRGNRNRTSVGRVHSSLSLEPDDLDVREHFRVTSVTRTIIDCAPRLSLRQLEAIVDSACRDRLTDEARLYERLVGLRRPGRSKLLLVLGADSATGRPHTWLERQLLTVLRSARAPLPRMQTELTTGGRLARVDAFYDAQRLIVEVAGHRTHSTRRQRQADNERRHRLEMSGCRVLEFTYEDVTQRPSYVVDTIVARLAVSH